jgi:hypothetical protein
MLKSSPTQIGELLHLIKTQREKTGNGAKLIVDIVCSVVVQFQLLVVVVPVEVEAGEEITAGIRSMPISVHSQGKNFFLLWFLHFEN